MTSYSRKQSRLVSLIGLAVCLGTLTLTLAKRDPGQDYDLLPGWMGSDFRPAGLPEPGQAPCSHSEVEVLDEEARIYLWRGFLSSAEADHIRALSSPHLSRSSVVDTSSGGSIDSGVRTSRGTFLQRGHDDVIQEVERRIALWTHLPVEYGEGLQVLLYEVGQKYDAHFDYFQHAEGTANGGNRYATVLMYLADTEEGGETSFPNLPAPGGVNPGFSPCAERVLAAKPHKGDAVLFHSMKPTGELEVNSLHEACPVLKGEKWSAAKWIHVGRYATNDEVPQRIDISVTRANPQGCSDADERCGQWARAGECTKNPVYMLGTHTSPGNCLVSCNRCDLMNKSATSLRRKLKSGW